MSAASGAIRPAGASEVSLWLQRWARGDGTALDRLLPLVYEQLRRMAAFQMRQERGDHTLQPTALVHEAFLKLAGTDRTPWEGRAHFFAVAGQAMRRVLVDHARRRSAAKRGGGATLVSLTLLSEAGAPSREVDVLALDEILSRLYLLDPRQAKIVELRCFAGMTVAEVGRALALSEATVQRDWRAARAWLRRELRRGGET